MEQISYTLISNKLRLRWRLLIAFAVSLVIAIIAASIGSVFIPPIAILQIILAKLPIIELFEPLPDSWSTIIWDIRLPRVVTSGLVGGSLALAGATYQGIFRNPLADPYLLGIAGGAGLGATVVLTTTIPLGIGGFSILPIAAFIGAVVAGLISYFISKRTTGISTPTLILSGIAIASLTASITSILLIRSTPDIKPLLSWLLGGFIGSQWNDTFIMLPYILIGTIITLSHARVLNVLQTSEEEAHYMGVNITRTKILLIAAASLVTAAAVSISGLIGFVGLIGPHAVRLLWGADYRILLPMSIIVGGSFLMIADLTARLVISPGELPVGVVTAFCGAPFFLYLIRRGDST